MLRVDENDLAFRIGCARCHSHSNIAGENIALVVIEHGVNVDAITLLESQLGDFCSVLEDVRPLVKQDRPLPAAKDIQSDAVANAVEAANNAAGQRRGSRRKWRRIQDGIMTVSRQRAGRRRGVQNFSLRLLWYGGF